MMSPTIGSETTVWLRKLKDANYAKAPSPDVPGKVGKELQKTGYAAMEDDGSLRITEEGYQYLRMLDRHDCT